MGLPLPTQFEDSVVPESLPEKLAALSTLAEKTQAELLECKAKFAIESEEYLTLSDALRASSSLKVIVEKALSVCDALLQQSSSSSASQVGNKAALQELVEMSECCGDSLKAIVRGFRNLATRGNSPDNA